MRQQWAVPRCQQCTNDSVWGRPGGPLVGCRDMFYQDVNSKGMQGWRALDTSKTLMSLAHAWQHMEAYA